MGRTALISGVAGQDGSYLLEFLLDRRYQVVGFDIDEAALARLAEVVAARPDGHLATLRPGDVTQRDEVEGLVAQTRPAEIYNLAAQSFVGRSHEDPFDDLVVVSGVLNLLESIRRQGLPARFYQASTAEMFGDAPATQSETTPLEPISPYACAKLYAHHMVRMYRDVHGLKAASGILFNHESPRRRTEFVTRKITHGVAAIVSGQATELRLGNFDARRDWGHARDYVRAMWLMLRRDEPADYVIASGVSRSVAEFAHFAFDLVGLDWRDYVVHDPALQRPSDPRNHCGNAARARVELGWRPEVSFEALVTEMLDADLEAHGLDPKSVRR
ncbi:GDPmannose 4,6-dehydratase [Asanoa ferruginea]|uniref:GDP-mannose 4,6-dehydratase n=1 Tax=Asanoa ferruginea TaxID=53367 RepID=A0A3D9ZJE9_9ACTN|nr:GDP-mannose 4,6-dehydratase [Asanoa ferruginea]REF96664.1 GDPmannose 4,6-dehydratase [Asanoa ferruginea]GIF48953.1 GDP-mannose 4,6-dehydratase [Asanoa ferruginea]